MIDLIQTKYASSLLYAIILTHSEFHAYFDKRDWWSEICLEYVIVLKDLILS